MLDLDNFENRRNRARRILQEHRDEVLHQFPVYPFKSHLWQTDELICYDVINPTQYVFHEDTETCTPVYTEYDEDYEKFYTAALRDVEEAKKTREYGLDTTNHPNWFDASYISWLSYDSLHLELPDGYLYFAPPFV